MFVVSRRKNSTRVVTIFDCKPIGFVSEMCTHYVFGKKHSTMVITVFFAASDRLADFKIWTDELKICQDFMTITIFFVASDRLADNANHAPPGLMHKIAEMRPGDIVPHGLVMPGGAGSLHLVQGQVSMECIHSLH